MCIYISVCVCVHLLKGFDPGNQFPLRGPEMTESGNSNCFFDVSYISNFSRGGFPLLPRSLAPSMTFLFILPPSSLAPFLLRYIDKLNQSIEHRLCSTVKSNSLCEELKSRVISYIIYLLLIV